MSHPARVCVVVLNWNQPAMTRRCLDHVRALTGVTFDVLVVDNGSTPENRRRLQAECGADCQLMWLPKNSGFAGGMNRGIEHALAGGSEYVWLLNNDAFPAPDCLAELVRAMDADPILGAVTPLLVDEDGSPQVLGARIDFTTGKHFYGYEYNFPGLKEPGVILIGAALLLRTSLLRKVGLFDERFFAYREDDDLCLRLVREGRASLGVCRTAVSIHLGNASTDPTNSFSPLSIHMMTRNTWLLFRKYVNGRKMFWLGLRYMAEMLYVAGHEKGLGRRPQSVTCVRGLIAGAVGRYGRPEVSVEHSIATRIILARPYHLGNGLNWLVDRFEPETGRGQKS